MYEDGYKNILNADVSGLMSDSEAYALDCLQQYSGILIEKMRRKHSDKPEMECM